MRFNSRIRLFQCYWHVWENRENARTAKGQAPLFLSICLCSSHCHCVYFQDSPESVQAQLCLCFTHAKCDFILRRGNRGGKKEGRPVSFTNKIKLYHLQHFTLSRFPAASFLMNRQTEKSACKVLKDGLQVPPPDRQISLGTQHPPQVINTNVGPGLFYKQQKNVIHNSFYTLTPAIYCVAILQLAESIKGHSVVKTDNNSSLCVEMCVGIRVLGHLLFFMPGLMMDQRLFGRVSLLTFSHTF